MDDRVGVFLWIIGGGLAFAGVGAIFGGIAGWFSYRHGHSSGTGFGRRVADAIARLFSHSLSETQRRVLVGAVDGAIFLGLVGIVAALVADRAGYEPASWYIPVFLYLLGGAALAMLFGTLAYGMVGRGWQSLGGVVFGGMVGMLIAVVWIGRDHLVPLAAGGMLLGAIVSFSFPRGRSEE